MRISNILFLLIGFGLLSACTDSNAININRQGSPALWKISEYNPNNPNNPKANAVEQNSKTLYLFGTIHLLPEGAKWQGNIIDNAIENSDILITETTGLENSNTLSKIFTRMATDEPTIDIIKRVNNEQAIALDNIITNQSLSKKALSNLETWAAALAISNSITSDMGLKRSLGVETILNARFNDSGKSIKGLETIESQLAIFDDLSEKEQRAMLVATLKSENDSKASFMRLLNAWLDGHSDILLKESEGGLLKSPTLKRALLDNRNRKWAKALIQKLQSADNQNYFVAVGAAHLIGETGVPALFKQAGYRVERLQ